MRDENLEIDQHMEIRLPFMKCFFKRGHSPTAVHHHKIKKNNWFICTPYVTLLSFISNSTHFHNKD